MVDVDTVVTFLLDRGLLHPDALIDGVVVHPVVRRNRNLRVCLADGSGFFVKQSDGLSSHNREAVRKEGLFYERQWAAARALSVMMPQLLLFDSSIPIVVLDLLSGYRTLGEYSRSSWPPVFPIRVWARLGRQLAAVHDEPAPNRGGHLRMDPLGAAAAWEPRPSMLTTLSPAGLQALRIVQESAEIGRGLKAVREAWQPLCSIHGDLRGDNVMVGGGEVDAEGIRLVDWETWGLGDPAWDVACAVAIGIGLSFTSECPGRGLNVVRRSHSRSVGDYSGCHSGFLARVSSGVHCRGCVRIRHRLESRPSSGCAVLADCHGDCCAAAVVAGTCRRVPPIGRNVSRILDVPRRSPWRSHDFGGPAQPCTRTSSGPQTCFRQGRLRR